MKYWIVGTLSVVTALVAGCATIADSTRVCQYDPESGVPNPLGMRAYITVTEEDGNTTFLFEQFPSNVGGAPEIAATIASRREMTFYNIGIDQARQIMLQQPDYYSELVGYSDPEGFAPVDQVLTCQ